MTLLLAVSALYIVIFSSVPSLGYLTTFDTFVVQLFIVLFVCCAVHSFIQRFQEVGKIEKWPLRKFWIRLLDFSGRVILIPLECYLFVVAFPHAETVNQRIGMWTFIAIFTVAIVVRESFSIAKHFKNAMIEIQIKIVDKKIKISHLEAILINFYVDKKLSNKISTDFKRTVELTEVQMGVKQATDSDDEQ